eukprot:scaffold2335_cov128-Skeletonema_marinoi.AAC.5
MAATDDGVSKYTDVNDVPNARIPYHELSDLEETNRHAVFRDVSAVSRLQLISFNRFNDTTTSLFEPNGNISMDLAVLTQLAEQSSTGNGQTPFFSLKWHQNFTQLYKNFSQTAMPKNEQEKDSNWQSALKAGEGKRRDNKTPNDEGQSYHHDGCK